MPSYQIFFSLTPFPILDTMPSEKDLEILKTRAVAEIIISSELMRSWNSFISGTSSASRVLRPFFFSSVNDAGTLTVNDVVNPYRSL